MSGVEFTMLAGNPPLSLFVLIFGGPILLAVVGLILAFRGHKKVVIALAVISCVASIWLLLDGDFWWLGLQPFMLGAIAVPVAYLQRGKMK